MFNIDGLSDIVSIDNIIAIDDRDTTFMKNVKNGLTIPAYNPDPDVKSLINDKDTALLNLMVWLASEKVMSSDNLRKLNFDCDFESNPDVDVHDLIESIIQERIDFILNNIRIM
jgi:hypothetical protein